MNRRSFLRFLGLAPIAVPMAMGGQGESGILIRGKLWRGERVMFASEKESLLVEVDASEARAQIDALVQQARAEADGYQGSWSADGHYYSLTCDADLGDPVCRWPGEYVDSNKSVVVL